MPEGPELHTSCMLINRICKGHIFSGKVVKNPIHKGADIAWDDPAYSITAEPRGKQMRLYLSSLQDEKVSKKANAQKGKKTLSILFAFGMSGRFEFTPANALLKHSHLSFFTKDEPKMALSFVDPRRFGKWKEGPWSADRGPCVILEYQNFVNNVVANLNNPTFKKPVCEALLNQRFFNGIGNYLRSEILYRCQIPPFERASTVLRLSDDAKEKCAEVKPVKGKQKRGKKETEISSDIKVEKTESDSTTVSDGVKAEVKCEQIIDGQQKDMSGMLTPKAQELLKLCHTVPLEVVQLGTTVKSSLTEMFTDSRRTFGSWLQCYCQPGMENMADHNKRTVWFSGPPGPLVPKDQKRVDVKISPAVRKPDKSKSSKGDTSKSVKSGKSKSVKAGKSKSAAGADTSDNPEATQLKSVKSKLTQKELKDSSEDKKPGGGKKEGNKRASTKKQKEPKQPSKQAQKKSKSDSEAAVVGSVHFQSSPAKKRQRQKSDGVKDGGSTAKRARVENLNNGRGVKGKRVTRASVGQPA